jgi:hypothetical protein
MELIKQMVDKTLKIYKVNIINNIIDPYDFFKSLALINAYFEITNKQCLSDKEIKWISTVYEHFNKTAISDTLSVIKKTDYKTKDEYRNELKKHLSLVQKTYLDELLNLSETYQSYVSRFIGSFMFGESKKSFFIKKYSKDINLKYAIGVVQEQKDEKGI